MWYFIGWSSFLIFFKLYLGFKVIGRENVPKKGAFIFASNHSSFLDPIVLGTSLYRSLNYMARDTLFNNRFLAWAFPKIHVFPVKRREASVGTMRKALEILTSGRPLVIFPEGTRSKDGTFKRGKPGIGFIVARTKMPVIPAYIGGSFEALPDDVSSLKRRPVKVYIGKPVIFDFDIRGKEAYQKISDEIMARIEGLSRLARGSR